MLLSGSRLALSLSGWLFCQVAFGVTYSNTCSSSITAGHSCVASFSGLVGSSTGVNLSAKANFDLSTGGLLTITVWNLGTTTSASAYKENDFLSAIFFGKSDLSHTFTPTSAKMNTGSGLVGPSSCANNAPPGDVSCQWGFDNYDGTTTAGVAGLP